MKIDKQSIIAALLQKNSRTLCDLKRDVKPPLTEWLLSRCMMLEAVHG